MDYGNKYIHELKNEFDRAGAVVLRVKVRPGAAEMAVKGIMADGTIKINIAAPPDRGRANNALIGYIAEIFGIAAKNVFLVSGRSSRQKTVKIIK